MHHLPPPCRMPQAFDPAAAYVEIQPLIDRVAAKICRRYNLSEHAEDVASCAKTKLLENDYADLRTYRGDAALPTYVTTVVINEFHEWRRRREGRWRHSAAARRLGPVAMELETLVVRDGMPLREAAEQLRARGKTELSDRDLAQMLDELPLRSPLRPVEAGSATLDTAHGEDSADAAIIAREEGERKRRMVAAMWEVIDALPPEDRLLMQMLFIDGRKVADAARALGRELKPLYKERDRILTVIRAAMEQKGFSAEDLRELMDQGREEGE